MEALQKVLELKATLDALRPLEPEQENRIMQKFRLDWNYHSNHLEGNSLTYGETKALLLFGITAQGKPLKDALEIKGHNEAISWVFEMVKGDRPLTENFIRELHSLLLEESYKASQNEKGEIVPRKIHSGKYKTTPNHVQTVTGEIFYFATPEETPAKMHDLLIWYNKKTQEETANPLLIAAEFHYRFIRIHPFDDGNGRTARILMNFILLFYGYPPVVIKTEDKLNYFAALRLADAGNIEPFILYIAENLLRSLNLMISGAKGEEIDDENDIKNELILLKKKLDAYNIKIEAENINIIKSNLVKVLNSFVSSCLHFGDLYDHYSFYFSYGNSIQEVGLFSEDSVDSFINNIINSLLHKVELFKIQAKYKTLAYKGFEKFNFENYLSFQILSNKFIIQNGSNIQHKFNLNHNLTDKEIKKIINVEIKRHTFFINSLLDNK